MIYIASLRIFFLFIPVTIQQYIAWWQAVISSLWGLIPLLYATRLMWWGWLLGRYYMHGGLSYICTAFTMVCNMWKMSLSWIWCRLSGPIYFNPSKAGSMPRNLTLVITVPIGVGTWWCLAQIARFMWPTWDQPGSCLTQVGLMWVPGTWLSGGASLESSPATWGSLFYDFVHWDVVSAGIYSMLARYNPSMDN